MAFRITKMKQFIQRFSLFLFLIPSFLNYYIFNFSKKLEQNHIKSIMGVELTKYFFFFWR